jgi:hypothetical protein
MLEHAMEAEHKTMKPEKLRSNMGEKTILSFWNASIQYYIFLTYLSIIHSKKHITYFVDMIRYFVHLHKLHNHALNSKTLLLIKEDNMITLINNKIL